MLTARATAALLLGGLGAISTGPAWARAAAGPEQHPPAAVAVAIVDGAYAPDPVTAAVGDTVTWTNADDIPHDVTAAPEPAGLRSPMLSPGESYSFTVAEAGTFAYLCTIHETMVGTLTVSAHVEEASAVAAPEPAEPAVSEPVAAVPEASVAPAETVPLAEASAAPAVAAPAPAAAPTAAATGGQRPAVAAAATPGPRLQVDLRLVGAALLTFALVASALALTSPRREADVS